MDAILANAVTKRYKNGVLALNEFNIAVKCGEIFTLLGQNGSGKSTLIRILTTYLKPTSGKISILGKDICLDAASIRLQIACVAQKVSIDTYLSLEENMMFQSRLYQISKAGAVKRMEQLIETFGLNEYRKYPVSTYSGGVRRRLDIALNMMSNPKILFLDEPTVGMDIQSRTAMWDMMKQIRSDFGATIFLTTHYLEEADHLSDTICIMKDGTDIIQGTPSELRSLIRQEAIKIRLPDDVDIKKYQTLFQDYFGWNRILYRDSSIVINTCNSHSDMEKSARLLLDNKLPFNSVEISQPALEDVFLRLTSAR